MKVVRLAPAERPAGYTPNSYKGIGRGSVTKRALEATKDQ